MDEKTTLLEVAHLLRKAASLLEKTAKGKGGGGAPRVKDMREKIRSALAHGALLSSAEVADALFDGVLGMDEGTWRRRVIVTLSSMHKKGLGVELVQTEGGPKWRLNETTTPPGEGGAIVEADGE